MPLETGASKEVVSRNIAKLYGEDRPQKQAVAIALSVAERAAGKLAEKKRPKRYGEK